jgi:predicted  nucleic acid-binding Zn-ribbon protein
MQEKSLSVEKQHLQLQAERDLLKESNFILENQVKKLKEEIQFFSNSESPMPSAESLKKLQVQDSNLKKRIRDLEQQLQQQTAKFSQWEVQKTEMVDELHQEIARLHHQNNELTERLNERQDARESKLKIELQTQLQATQAALEAALSKASTLEMRLELQENARKTIQQTTLDLLKETQRESSKMAFTHTQKSIDLLKLEWKREQELILGQREREHRSHIQRLQKQLEREGVAQIRKELYQMEQQYQELQKEHSDCLSRLESLQSGATPSSAEFDRLAAKIKHLEAKSSQSDLARELGLVKKECTELKKSLKAKDLRIREFGKEIEDLLNGIIQMKREIQYL